MAHARNGGEHRGNTRDRRRRKLWLLSAAAGFGGTGRCVPCFWCSKRLTLGNITTDRFPICGHRGGSYRRNNVVPACLSCNRRRCSLAARHPRLIVNVCIPAAVR